MDAQRPYTLFKFYDGAWRIVSRHASYGRLRTDVNAMRKSNRGIEFAWTLGDSLILKGIPMMGSKKPAPVPVPGPIIS